MNKTLNIGLAGYSFIIEENAYQLLNSYIKALRNSISPEEADEVMLDIEYRMVEIFRENLKNREVINEDDVEKVIAQIGKPEAIEEQEYTGDNNTNINNTKRVLYRDTTNQKIAGVCSGLAQWTKIDTSLMRIAWIVTFFFGLFVTPPFFIVIFIAYISLWAILPKAYTAADFLKMKGKPLNFDNIKDESTKLNQGQDISNNASGTRVAGSHRDDSVWKLIRYFLGILFTIAALFLLILIIPIFYLENEILNSINLPIYYYLEIIPYFKALYILILLCPTLIFTIIAIKFFSPKTKIRNIAYLSLLLFLATIIMIFIVVLQFQNKHTNYYGIKDDVKNISINTQKDTLYIDVKQNVIPKSLAHSSENQFTDKIFLTDKKTVYKKSPLELSVTRNNHIDIPYLIVKTRANGSNLPIKSKINLEVKDNTILLPNYIQYPYSESLRDYRVDYELVIPHSKTVINKSLDISIDDDEYDDTNNYSTNSKTDTQTIQYIQNLNYNGNKMKIEKNSAFGDSIKIDGKMYQEDVAEQMIDDFKEKNYK